MVQALGQLSAQRRGRGRKTAFAARRAAPPRPTMRWRTAILFVLPAFALYSLFIVYPLLSALTDSFWTWQGTARGSFAGFGNFTGLFHQFPLNHQLRAAFWHTVIFFVGTMIVQNTVGLLIAVLLSERRFGKRFLEAAYALPYLIGALVVGYLWQLLLSPVWGPVNKAMSAVGLSSLTRPWLGDPSTALPVVIIVNAWHYIGFPILLFGAALAGIPAELRDATRIDGATAWQRFRHVTLPLLTPAIGLVSILTFISCFNAFEIVYGLFGQQGNQPAGPAGSADLLGLIFYRVAFQEGGENAIGQSSAIAALMFVLIFGVAAVANWYFRRREALLT